MVAIDWCTGGGTYRKTYVQFVCNPTGDDSSLFIVSEAPLCTYTFIFSTPRACVVADAASIWSTTLIVAVASCTTLGLLVAVAVVRTVQRCRREGKACGCVYNAAPAATASPISGSGEGNINSNRRYADLATPRSDGHIPGQEMSMTAAYVHAQPNNNMFDDISVSFS